MQPTMLKAEQEGSGLSSPSFGQVRSIRPNIGITARRAKQISSVLMIREQRDQRKQEVAFNARPFVLCGIPLRPVPKDQLTHKRRNGKFFLHIMAHPDFGLLQADSESNWAAGFTRKTVSFDVKSINGSA